MKEQLERDRAEVLELLSRLQEGLIVTSEGDDTEKILAFSAREQTSRDIERLQQRKKDLDRALVKISSFGFGVCEDCGEGIGLKRLAAVPTASLCVKCQERKERTNQ